MKPPKKQKSVKRVVKAITVIVLRNRPFNRSIASALGIGFEEDITLEKVLERAKKDHPDHDYLDHSTIQFEVETLPKKTK